MQKYICLMFLSLVLIGCTKETKEIIIVEVGPDSIQQDPDDRDGDGVKNIIEEIDGTNPQAPCSYLEERQNYEDTTENWRNLDCDGDGVTNGNELDPDGNNSNNGDGTDPRNQCDLVASQQTVTPSQAWSQLDCDKDGVTNGREANDGTDPLDPCSLVLSSQTSQPESWLALDCDDDCVRNELELEDGTNPLDGKDFLGNGKALVRMVDYAGQIITLDESGSRYSTIANADGTVTRTFNYTNNKLTLAQIGNTDYTFEYQNNLLAKITTTGGTTTTNDIEYEGNSIIATGSNAAPNQFYIKLTFDATGERLLTKERFFIQNNQWVLAVETFIYFSNGRTWKMLRKFFDYNSVTGTLTEKVFEDEGAIYSYHPQINNPLKEASDKIKLPIYFIPQLVFPITGRPDNEHTLFESVYLRQWWWTDKNFGFFGFMNMNCVNAQGNPTRGARLSQYGDFINDIIFIYE